MKKRFPKHLDLAEINRQISYTWDNNVLIRAKDLTERTDLTYTKIIEPWVIEQVVECSLPDSRILDIGCGCGYLTNIVCKNDRGRITGIDISANSVACAKKMYPHIEFIHQDIYGFLPEHTFDLCLAVMVLNNIPDINLFFHKMKAVLADNGAVVAVVPHPCFWPDNHIKDEKFKYLAEERYKIRFATKGEKNYPSEISYFHRPLEQYIECFRENGFSVSKFVELPELTENENPDILGIVLKNIKC